MLLTKFNFATFVLNNILNKKCKPRDIDYYLNNVLLDKNQWFLSILNGLKFDTNYCDDYGWNSTFKGFCCQ